MNEHDDQLLLEARLTDRFQADSDRIPPAGIDLDRARSEGRSMRVRRRAGGGGVTVVVVASLVAAVFATYNGMQARPAPLVQPSRPSLGTKTAVPESQDPLRETLQFADPPAGFVLTGVDGDGTLAAATASDGSTRLSLLQGLQSAADQACMAATAFGPGTTGENEPMGCSPSTGPGAASIIWLYKPGTAAAKNQGAAELMWRYAPNSYAALYASLGSMSAANLIKVMTEVVENGVRTEPAAAAAMPFHLPAAPAGLTLAYAYSVIGKDGDQVGEAANGDPDFAVPDLGTAAGLEYGGIDAVLGNLPGLTITVQSAAADFPTPFETQLGGQHPSAAQTKSLTVGGHTARTVSLDGYEALVVHDVNGFDVRIAVAGTSALAAVATDGGLVGYFDKITFYNVNPATWTYDVIGS